MKTVKNSVHASIFGGEFSFASLCMNAENTMPVKEHETDTTALDTAV